MMTELTVVVPDEVAERLADEAHQRGMSAEAVASEVLTVHVPEPSRRHPRFIGSGRSGRGDLSERAEELLAASLGR
jgi:hypothetical protein